MQFSSVLQLQLLLSNCPEIKLSLHKTIIAVSVRCFALSGNVLTARQCLELIALVLRIICQSMIMSRSFMQPRSAARDGVEGWELSEMKELRKESPVMEQLWTDAIVELESELGKDWKGLMHHHSMSDPSYTPRSR